MLRSVLRKIFLGLAVAAFLATVIYCGVLLLGDDLIMEGQTMPRAMNIGAAALFFLLGNVVTWFMLACARVARPREN